ncbi:MAG TPA: 30S ribosomal protein S2 [Candidatus Doudnabacteria bacterium]|nr:30S ribosomal protein S2 [Candidatus Doudnabacteria bacterium]
MKTDISLLDLLKSGAHFGHKSSRWNPKMKPFIFTVRNNIHIIDLEKTRTGLQKASDFVADTVKSGGTILFIGTKRQCRDIVKQQALECGMPFVNLRWLGGTFTNFRTIQKTVRKLEKLQQRKDSPDFEIKYTKKERLLIEREIEKLTKLFEGIKDMKRTPQAVFITDIHHDDIALTEARKMKVPIIAIVDTNTDPSLVDYPIPANDDATAAVQLITSVIANTIKANKSAAVATTGVTKTTAPAEDN